MLEFLSKGYLYKEIADQLGISTGTVRQHIHKRYAPVFSLMLHAVRKLIDVATNDWLCGIYFKLNECKPPS